MRIRSVSGSGLLSFDGFTLPLERRLTLVVGPNGSGKSNLGRLLELVRLALQWADRSSPAIEERMSSFLSGARRPLPPQGIEVRVGLDLNEEFERRLVALYLQTAIAHALIGHTGGFNEDPIENWVGAQVTVRKLQPLFEGDIIVTHRGTLDAPWEVGYEFPVRLSRRPELFRWLFRGSLSDAIVATADIGRRQINADDLAARIRGARRTQQPRPTAPSGTFALSRMMPRKGRSVSCAFDLGRVPPVRGARAFTEMVGLDPFGGPDQIRHLSFARVLLLVLQQGLIQTSDTRRLPTSAVSWSLPAGQLRSGGEGNLGEMTLSLKNGPADQRPRWDQVRKMFWQFSGSRQLDVMAVPDPSSQDQGDGGVRVRPRLLVSVDPTPTPDSREPLNQVPIDFAGAGAWEALALAAVLGSQPGSTVFLDEPAIALHPIMQRCLRGHLEMSAFQSVVTTHSPYLIPLGAPLNEVKVVRLDRDDHSATRAHIVPSQLLIKLASKLVGKGNESVFFARAAVLCEGETDVAAVRALDRRLGLEFDSKNVGVFDCGSRDNLPDYVALSDALGIRALAVMDADSSKAAGHPAVARMANAVRIAASKAHMCQLVEFPEDIETTLGIAKQRPSRVPEALEALKLDTRRWPAELKQLAKQLQWLVEDSM